VWIASALGLFNPSPAATRGTDLPQHPPLKNHTILIQTLQPTTTSPSAPRLPFRRLDTTTSNYCLPLLPSSLIYFTHPTNQPTNQPSAPQWLPNCSSACLSPALQPWFCPRPRRARQAAARDRTRFSSRSVSITSCPCRLHPICVSPGRAVLGMALCSNRTSWANPLSSLRSP